MNLADNSLTSENYEGIVDSSEVVYLNLEDHEVASILGNRITESENWWNKEYDLKNVRGSTENMWLNKSFDENDLFDYQVPYKDNRLFVAIETLVPLVLESPAEPVVSEADDSPASKELAYNVQRFLTTKTEECNIKTSLEGVARHVLMGKRIGIMKYYWDNSVGQLQEDGTRFGDFKFDVIRPERVVFESHSMDPEDVPLIAEGKESTVEELGIMFPEKKDELWKAVGVQRGTQRQLNQRIGYREVWFNFFDKKTKQKTEAVSWKYNNVILGKIKNPNWNYDETETDTFGRIHSLNFYNRPRKPYILFNYLNLNKYIMDDTSLIEQAAVQQDILNKRGRQIVENADQANAGLIFNSEMVNNDDVANLTGDPGEKIMATGNVNEAAARLPMNVLPDYVIQDKVDARNEIDNIFATHAPVRGEKSNAPTLGQEIMSQRSDIGRVKVLASALEKGTTKVYEAMLQMAKVFYTDEMAVKYTSKSGATEFIPFSSKTIQDGITLRVKAGSQLPVDKITKHNEAIQTATMTDPLTLAEGLDMPDATEAAKRMTFYKLMPDRYLTEILGVTDEGGPDYGAMQDIESINEGREPEKRQGVSKEYIATYDNYLRSPGFGTLLPMMQEAHRALVQKYIDESKQTMGMEQPPEGQPPEGMPPEMMGGEQNVPGMPAPELTPPTEEDVKKGGMSGFLSNINRIVRPGGK